MDLPVFANDGLQIEITAILVCKARIESGCRLAPGLANFISFERAFYDISDGPMFMARQVASLGTTHRELGFGPAGDPCLSGIPPLNGKPASDGKMAIDAVPSKAVAFRRAAERPAKRSTS